MGQRMMVSEAEAAELIIEGSLAAGPTGLLIGTGFAVGWVAVALANGIIHAPSVPIHRREVLLFVLRQDRVTGVWQPLTGH